MISDILSREDIQYLNALPEVLAAKAKLNSTSVIYFSIKLTETIRAALKERLGLDLSNVDEIPMRWIKGDTAPHIDSGASNFEKTYLMYLNDSEGQFVLGEDSFSIQENTGFVFNEGILHKTVGTGVEPRLLLGPMNEFAESVGLPVNPCFLEGSKILCLVNGVETYMPIQQLTPGTLVKTNLNGFKQIKIIGRGEIQNPDSSERLSQRLYKLSPSNYPELKEDLYLTGCHSILVDSLTDTQRADIVKHVPQVQVTDKKYRLLTCVDDRAEPWASEGTYAIWHFALDNDNEVKNYGVYANGGLLVETCCIKRMREKSNMELIK